MVKSIEGITVNITDGNIEIDDNIAIKLSVDVPTAIIDIRVYDTGAIKIIDDENNWIFFSVSMGTASAIAKEVATWSK